jgi:HAD superfamily hydrolase (TIGR01549 family)
MHSSFSRVKCLIFDLDDTLVHSSLAYEKALLGIGLSLNDKNYIKARAAVKKNLGSGQTAAHNRLLYFKLLLEQKNAFRADAALKLMQQYESLLSLEFKKQWRQLKREKLLQKLSKKYKLLIFTNENLRTQLLKLQAIDPKNKLFSGLLASEEIGAEKPSKKSFQALLQAAKLPAASCLMIGDSMSIDILPAKRLGMATILSTEFQKHPEKIRPGLTVQIQKLAQLELLL